MTKAEMIQQISQETGLWQKDVEKVLQSIVARISEELASGSKVALTGLGTFGISERKARTGRNPRTGEPMEIPARKSIKFKAGKTLTDDIQD